MTPRHDPDDSHRPGDGQPWPRQWRLVPCGADDDLTAQAAAEAERAGSLPPPVIITVPLDGLDELA